LDTKAKLLAASGELFRRQGYSGTGLKEITAEAGATWGSMYHFFPDGKEQLGAEAVLAAGQVYGAQMAAVFERSKNPAKAVDAFFANEIEVLRRSDFRDGCPIASVALDVASTADRVRAACSQGFLEWQAIIAAAFVRGGASEARAATLAAFVLATLEGAIVLSRTHRSTAPLASAREMVDRLLRGPLDD
jgi:TetR/AcrR family transcriptional repressor of lmrAB and yxaGH operons